MRAERSPIIENFRKHLSPENLKNLGVSDWKNIISGELSGIFSTRTYSFNPGFLYRARLNFDSNGKAVDFFGNVNDLWAPPFKKVKHQGRCNLVSQSLLYCSTNLATTLFELSTETDSEITVIEYKCIEEFKNLGVIGVNEIILVNDSYRRIFGDHFKDRNEETKLLDEILSIIFKGKTRNTQAFPIYNLTNAITQIFLNQQKKGFLPPGYTLPPTNIGLIYPSVETSIPLGVNIVLNPNSAKKYLKPTTAHKYKITHKPSSDLLNILLTHKTRIQPNGQMVWEHCYDSHIEHITHLPTTKDNAQ